MIIKRCDRCNNETQIKSILSIPNEKPEWIPTFTITYIKDGSVGHIDLCEHCENELHQWLENN